VELGGDTKAVLLAAGLIFSGALLLYSFATLLIATFVELSGWSTAVNLIAAFAVIAFFVGAISGYTYHGIRRDTENQFREGEDPPGLHPFMWALIVVEIAGFSVLLAGFVSEQIL
jgi:amino acid transporter